MIGLSECVEDALIEGAGRWDLGEDRGGGAHFQRQGLTALREFELDRRQCGDSRRSWVRCYRRRCGGMQQRLQKGRLSGRRESPMSPRWADAIQQTWILRVSL